MPGTVLGITLQHEQYRNNAYLTGVYSPGGETTKKETIIKQCNKFRRCTVESPNPSCGIKEGIP